MRTYKLCLVGLAVLFAACSSDEGSENPEEIPNVDADYSVLLSHDNILSNELLEADAESIMLDSEISPFASASLPELSYREDKLLSTFSMKADCSGEIIQYNFGDYTSIRIDVFQDLQDCEMEAIALTHSGNVFYVAYSVPGLGLKETHYFVRIIDASGSEPSFIEVDVEKEPRQMIHASSKLFVLSLDPEEDNKYSLTVLDENNGGILNDVNLDFDAQKIFKTTDHDIMVSYPELHLIVSSTTMGILSTVRYNEGTEPKFGASKMAQFHASGDLYYTVPTDLSGTEYPNIPGVYDFETNTAILYFYENFLTEQERDFEYEIADTSVVAYDAANNLILIGYKKLNDPNKGGILRIRPIPDPAFIDNIDLEGVPTEIFVD